jgi:hypothetical protein
MLVPRNRYHVGEAARPQRRRDCPRRGLSRRDLETPMQERPKALTPQGTAGSASKKEANALPAVYLAPIPAVEPARHSRASERACDMRDGWSPIDQRADGVAWRWPERPLHGEQPPAGVDAVRQRAARGVTRERPGAGRLLLRDAIGEDADDEARGTRLRRKGSRGERKQQDREHGHDPESHATKIDAAPVMNPLRISLWGPGPRLLARTALFELAVGTVPEGDCPGRCAPRSRPNAKEARDGPSSWVLPPVGVTGVR